MALAQSSGVEHEKIQQGTRANTFYSTDQDALNMAAMFADVPLSTIGPEGMGFIPGGFTMYHTVGSPKPWRKSFLKSALAGVPPWNGDKHFLECADGPIHPFTRSELKTLRRSARLGAMIGRFNRRG